MKMTETNGKFVIRPLGNISRATQPIIINKNKKITLKKVLQNKMTSKTIREDIVFDSRSGGNFFRGTPDNVVILNQLNLSTNSCRTLAKYTSDNSTTVEKSSDAVANVIGQQNYDMVFSALCSVINQELKVRAIMALLKQDNFESVSCQTEESKTPLKVEVDEKCIQTDENCMEVIFRMKQPKRIKRQFLMPYVVKQEIKRVVVPVSTMEQKESDVKSESSSESAPVLPVLQIQLSEDSNEGSCNLSISGCTEEILNDPTHFLESSIDKCTRPEQPVQRPNPTILDMLDGTRIFLPVKPEDHFHYAIPEILKSVTSEERRKILLYQAFIDWKYCDERDNFGYLPIHRAVLDNDIDLLRRQCLVRKNRQESLDIVVENQTPLQLSIQTSPQCTSMLLQHGADPLFTDDEHRTCLHLAAEVTPDHLKAVVNHCLNNARAIFEDHEEIYKTEYHNKTNKELGQLLMDFMCHMVDSQGYTPLMLASRMGNYTNVKALLEACPKSVNLTNSNNGNTALFLAVGDACIEAAARGNKSKVSDKYHQTVTALIDNGAEPAIENYAGTSVFTLLTDANNVELSNIIANSRVSTLKHNKGHIESGFQDFMILKDKSGNMNVVTTKDSVVKKPRSVTKKDKYKIDLMSPEVFQSESDGQSGQSVTFNGQVVTLSGPSATLSGPSATLSGPSATSSSATSSKSVSSSFGRLSDKIIGTDQSVTKVTSESIVAQNKPVILQNIKLPKCVARIGSAIPSSGISPPPGKLETVRVLVKMPISKLSSLKTQTDGLKSSSEGEPSAKKLKS